MPLFIASLSPAHSFPRLWSCHLSLGLGDVETLKGPGQDEATCGTLCACLLPSQGDSATQGLERSLTPCKAGIWGLALFPLFLGSAITPVLSVTLKSPLVCTCANAIIQIWLFLLGSFHLAQCLQSSSVVQCV